MSDARSGSSGGAAGARAPGLALAEVAQIVSGYMERIVKLFKPGVKITVLVRVPDHPTRDFMMTDDTPDAIIEMLERRKAAGADPVEDR